MSRSAREVVHEELTRLCHSDDMPEIEDDTDLFVDLKIDSLKIVELLFALENRLSVSLEIENMFSCRTVAGLVGEIESKVACP